jgi:hypothetical protein
LTEYGKFSPPVRLQSVLRRLICDIGPSVELRHTYSAYGRGSEPLLGTFAYLDLTQGRSFHVGEVPHHDRYGGADPDTHVRFLTTGAG